MMHCSRVTLYIYCHKTRDYLLEIFASSKSVFYFYSLFITLVMRVCTFMFIEFVHVLCLFTIHCSLFTVHCSMSSHLCTSDIFSLFDWVYSISFSHLFQFDGLFLLSVMNFRETLEQESHLSVFWCVKLLLQASRHVGDLFEDLRDGHNLISLLEVLSGEHLVSILKYFLFIILF